MTVFFVKNISWKNIVHKAYLYYCNWMINYQWSLVLYLLISVIAFEIIVQHPNMVILRHVRMKDWKIHSLGINKPQPDSHSYHYWEKYKTLGSLKDNHICKYLSDKLENMNIIPYAQLKKYWSSGNTITWITDYTK